MRRTGIFAALSVAAVVFTGNTLGADSEQGRARSLACQACHGSSGVSVAPDIPNLAGQKQPYLTAQLKAFRAGDRKNDFMNPIAKQLSDDDIANLAAFWSGLPPAGGNAADPAAEFRGSHVVFPKDFPKDFVLYHETIDVARKTSSRSFANRAAVKAAREGKPLPSGSMVVVENSAGGEVKGYSAMEARAGWGAAIPELLRNGDWNYALFDAAKQRREFNYARCLACHKPKADSSYLFGLDDLAKAQ